ncbi:uncharacterized protein F5891DRAFT_1087339 [Suillus fuscotomentosus]|uniref:Uncharacterized protein n=1 Tax=Suillus fuscotomentosus TaxID=1912939 RepID=A0AAD4DN46_9AGAM|nr:uncharacterized protein F5891DRAFT_1087339 [Suillus fuscotomentosus]KAG1885326.1 hypothetical protein F5891DRAFT_1087339 [Suillus fuscotomentosus]
MDVDGVGGFRIHELQPQLYPPDHSHIAHSWAANGQITPGTITYTTSTNSADGQVTKHPFRAVPVSYQTSQGIVHGLQWVPTDATQILLTGTQLPNTGLAAGSFALDLSGREDDVVSKKWYEQIPHFTYPGGPDPTVLAASLSSVRGRSPYSARAPSPMSHSRPASHVPSPYQSRPQSRSPYPFHHTPSPDVRTHPRAPYQSRQQSRSPYSFHRTPSLHIIPPQIVYPHGHALEDQPILDPQLQVPSPFPNAPTGPEFYSSSRMPIIAFHRESMSDSSPHPFARPPDATQAYTPFSMIRIHGMDQFSNQIPSMPSVLDTHDVYHQDWGAFMNSIFLAWMGKLPLPKFAGGCSPSRDSAVVDLINLWNNSFFGPRRVEVVLYKGRERWSGPYAGTVDNELSFPESERDNERERKYSLYLTYVVSYLGDQLEPTGSRDRLRSHSGAHRNHASYNYYH